MALWPRWWKQRTERSNEMFRTKQQNLGPHQTKGSCQLLLAHAAAYFVRFSLLLFRVLLVHLLEACNVLNPSAYSLTSAAPTTHLPHSTLPLISCVLCPIYQSCLYHHHTSLLTATSQFTSRHSSRKRPETLLMLLASQFHRGASTPCLLHPHLRQQKAPFELCCNAGSVYPRHLERPS